MKGTAINLSHQAVGGRKKVVPTYLWIENEVLCHLHGWIYGRKMQGHVRFIKGISVGDISNVGDIRKIYSIIHK